MQKYNCKRLFYIHKGGVNRRGYPEYILEYLRQREGLDDDDTSMGEEFNEMDKDEVLDEALNWLGLIGCGGTIRGLVEDIYDIVLE